MLLLYFAAGAAGLVLLLFAPQLALGKFLFNLFLLQLFIVATIVPHELGHAFVARWCGFEVPKVMIGFGEPAFNCRLFGFPFEFRRVPMGGVTVALPDSNPRLRLRWFLLVLAGPTVNLLLAGVVYYVAGKEVRLSLSGPVNFVGIFVLANIIVLIGNLIPFQTASVYGPVNSDGLQLLQLLFGRRTPKPNPPKRGIPVLKILGSVFLFVCALLCWGLFALMLFGKFKDSIVILVLIELLFGFMGSVLIWAIFRLWKSPGGSAAISAMSGPDLSLSPYAPVLSAYNADLARINEWPEGVSPPTFSIELNSLMNGRDFAKAEQKLQRALERSPRNLSFQINYAGALGGLGKVDEAIASYDEVLAWNDLSSGAKAALQADLLHFLVLSGRFDEARLRCEAFLAQTSSTIEKVFVLDSLACVTHMDNRMDYLAEADRWSIMALELEPNFLTVKGTRGAVLADQRMFIEARPLLQEVYDKSEADNDKGISSLYLALCAKADGDLITARKLAKQAARILPQPWLLKRIQNEHLS